MPTYWSPIIVSQTLVQQINGLQSIDSQTMYSIGSLTFGSQIIGFQTTGSQTIRFELMITNSVFVLFYNLFNHKQWAHCTNCSVLCVNNPQAFRPL